MDALADRSSIAVLVVDDRPEQLTALTALLAGGDWRLITATSGEQALRVLLQVDVAVVLLDVRMPGMDGYETARQIRSRARNAHTPIIFVTAHAPDETPVERGYALGAVDYLFAPVRREVLRAKVQVFTELFRLRAALEERHASSENRYAALAEAIPHLVWSTDADGRMIYANQRWLDYVGMPLAQARDSGWIEVVHPADLDQVMTSWNQAVSTGAPYDIELRLRRGSDQAFRWHLCRGVPGRDDTGRIDGWVGSMTDIHDLRETERRFRWLIENTTEAIWRFDVDVPVPIHAGEDEQIDLIYRHGVLGECNEAMVRAYGFASADEMRGVRLGDLMPRSDPANDAMLRAFVGSGYRLVDAESSELAKDGSERCFLNNLIGEIEGGSLVRAWGTSRDITERKQRERQLAARERQLTLITDTLPALIAYVDADERYRFVNRTYEAWFAQPSAAFIGRGIAELMTPETHAKVAPMLRRALAGESVAYEASMTFPAAGRREVDASYVADRGPDGVVHGAVVFVQDVTARKRDEERARLLADATAALSATLDQREALDRLAALLIGRIADGVVIETANQQGRLERILGRHADPAREREMAEQALRHPIRAGDPAAQVFAEAAPRRFVMDEASQAAYARDDQHLAQMRGQIGTGMLIAPLTARGRALGTLTVLSDPGSQRQHDDADLDVVAELARNAGLVLDNLRLYHEAHRQRSLAARRAEQLTASNAELEQFAYVASHDLQEPLRMVTQYMGLIDRKYAAQLDERGRSYVAYAVDGAVRMHQLIADLLAYARTGRSQQAFTVFDAREVVDESLRTLAGQIDERQAIVDVAPLPRIRGDRTRLALVFQNLIANALKFSSAPARVAITAINRGDDVEFAIADRGIGIDPQFFERIFEVFQRLHSREQYPGTGIGLAICRKIVSGHGGRIWVESQPGEGAIFRFTVPSADAPITGLHKAL
ncbi:MAG TPA: PAS domain-containing protein [Planctomycetota bacterium]|nr:PAS domain-containing protein [Planctomycetota bacterium]